MVWLLNRGRSKQRNWVPGRGEKEKSSSRSNRPLCIGSREIKATKTHRMEWIFLFCVREVIVTDRQMVLNAERAQAFEGWEAIGFNSIWQYFHDNLCIGIIDAHVCKQVCTPVHTCAEVREGCYVLLPLSYFPETRILNEWEVRLEPEMSSAPTVCMHCPSFLLPPPAPVVELQAHT